MFIAPGPTDPAHASVAVRKRGLGVAERGVHHRLLVLALVVGQLVAELLECLAEADDVAVAEDPEHARGSAAGGAPSRSLYWTER